MNGSEFLDQEPRIEVRGASPTRREIRRVPLTFEHPRNEHGDYIGLFGSFERVYEPEDIQWMIEEGEIQSADDLKALAMPDFSDVAEEEMGICAYETCSEGTPISTVFPDTPQGRLELLKYVAEYETTYGRHQNNIEAWAAILFGKEEVPIVGIHDGHLTVTNPPPIEE